MNKLTYLYLTNSELAYIEDGALRDLSSLKQLHLDGNKLQFVSDNVFEGLTDLTLLYLNDNPEFPLTALIQAKSVIELYLSQNGYHTLEPYVFQQMDSLRYLYLSDPFVCDCDLRWTSLVGQYGLNILNGVCDNHFSRSITSVTLYTNCSQTESFQCFNKSITCPDNQVCSNTEDSYFCGCSRGYVLHSLVQCEDVDECNGTTDCQHTCQNTEGSFHCTCDEGYELSSDGYSCDDIDECQVLYGGCEFGCRNSVGSYQCECHYGLELINKTHCDTEFQCDILKNDVDQGNHFVCHEGFNLTISSVTCNNSTDHAMLQIHENQSPAISNEQQTFTIIVVLLILIIGFQTVVIILILLCDSRMMTAKNPKILQSKVQYQRNVNIPFEELDDKQIHIVHDTIMENSDAMVADQTKSMK